MTENHRKEQLEKEETRTGGEEGAKENVQWEKNPQLRRYFLSMGAKKGIPISGNFELTPRCNMNCRMCYIRMSKEEMEKRGREFTAEEWIEMGKTCAEEGMLFLLLTGGEPFLRPDFRQIYTELKKLGLFLSINTNGTLIDEETVEWLKKDPPAKINITLYGDNEETYERLCGYKEGYQRAVKAIDMLTKAGILVGINVSLTPLNLKDFPGIVQFAKERNINIRVTTYMFPPVRNAREGKVDEEARFTWKEMGEARYLSVKETLSEEEFTFMKKAFEQGVFELDLDSGDCDRFSGEKMGCMAGKSAFWITWDGRMTPCGLFNTPVAYPFDEGFVPAWEKIKAETDKILLPPECKTCKARSICMLCGALATAEGAGDSTRRPEYLCRGTKAYIERVKQDL